MPFRISGDDPEHEYYEARLHLQVFLRTRGMVRDRPRVDGGTGGLDSAVAYLIKTRGCISAVVELELVHQHKEEGC